MEPGAIPLLTFLRPGPIARIGSLWLLASLVAASHASARDLVIALRPDLGDAARNALADSFVQPFASANGLKVETVTRARDPAVPRDETQGPAWDVVQLTGPELIAGCAQGTLEKLDWAALGGRDRVIPRAAADCGMGAALRATVLAWDREKFQATPTWIDFGDIAKNPGKRGLRRGVIGTLEIALLADGVSAGDIYSTLRGADGVERAFRKLDQLKPYLVFWSDGGEKPADAVAILGSGEVLMTSAPAEQVVQANREGRRNFGVQWTGALSDLDSWAIAKGSPNLAIAQKFLAFTADPRVEARLAAAALGGVARNAAEGLAPDVLAIDPGSPANLAASVPMDAAFWRENMEKLGPRFEAWLAR